MSVSYKAFFGFSVGKPGDSDMLVTVKNTAAEMKLLVLFILLMCVVSSHSSEPGNCEFNFTYNGQSVVYNFSRLSRQESWETTNGRYRASISVCHPLSTPSQCQNSLLCSSGQDGAVWNVMISNLTTYVQSSQSQPSKPVLRLDSMQSCRGDKKYSAEFYFHCSSVELDPVLIEVREGCTLLVMWHTSAACPVDTNCTLDGINFSSLRRSDYYEVEGSGGQKFLLNVCGPVHSDVPNAADGVTAYEIRKNDSMRIVGRLDGYHLKMSQQKGVVLTYRNSSKAVTTEIQFVCNISAVNTNPKFLGNSGKTYLFELETPLACKMWPQECMVLDHNGARVDLSPLRKSSGNWVTKPSSTGVQYHINVCGPLNPVPAHNCSDGAAGACKTDSHSSVSLGYISSGLRITVSDTVIMEYTGGSVCPSGGKHSIRIEFFCSRVVGEPVFVKETAGCVHHFSWITSVSCPSLVDVGENCIVREKQYGNVLNLMVLHSPSVDYSLTTEHGDRYDINVCGPLRTHCNGHEASVCLSKENGQSFAIGRVNKTVLYDNGALRFVLYGEGCEPRTNRSTVTIILLCWQGSDTGRPELLSWDGDCNFYYVWYTAAACPPHHSTDCSVMHDGRFYDLTPLSDSMTNHVVVPTGMNVKFLLNVCQSVVFGKDASCQYASAACLVNISNPTTSTRFTNIGEVGNGPYFEDGKLKLKYEGGIICTDPAGPDHTSTVITFECANTDYVPELLPGGVCVYEFLWRTSAACPVDLKTEPAREDDGCTVAIPGTSDRVNLRALRSSVITVSGSKGYNYTLVVCGNLTSSHCGTSGVGVCQFNTKDLSDFKNAGVGNSRLRYSQDGILLEYTDGDPCSDRTKRSTKIVFICEPHGPERVVFLGEPDSCKYLINWYTDLACSKQVECTTPVSKDSPPISLARLIRSDENYKVQFGSDAIIYINVCRPLLPVQGLSCLVGSSACMASLHNDILIDEKSLGFAVGPVKVDSGKVSIMYVYGSTCNSSFNYSSKIEFECDPKSGQGQPEFKMLTDDCQYQFVWKTGVICEPFVKDVSLSGGQCMLSNEQINASMDLKTLGQNGVMQVQGFSVNLCDTEAVLHASNGTSYGTPTSVIFDYQQQQVRLMFTGGSVCTSTETYNSQLLLNCGGDAGPDKPRLVTKNDCSVVMEWQNGAICELLDPTTVRTVLHSEDTRSSAVGLVVGPILLVAALCLLALYFRKPTHCKHFRSRVTSMFSVRHNGPFYYSRLEAADEASQLLVSQMDGQESDSDDELLRM